MKGNVRRMPDHHLTGEETFVNISGLFWFQVYPEAKRFALSSRTNEKPAKRVFHLCAMRDLNSRPSRCKRAALPTELIAHVFIRTIVPNF